MRSIRKGSLLFVGLVMLTGMLTLPHPATTVLAQATGAVQPPAGLPGTTFAFFAEGLSGNARYAYWATSPNGTIFGDEDYRTRTFGSRADWTWTSPGDAQPGTWLMVIQRVPNDDDDDEEKEEKRRDRATISFVILGPGGAPPPSAPPAQPPAGQQAVQPAVGAPGTEFAFFATGFDGGERVGFWVNAPDGTILSDGDWSVTSNSDGRADWRWGSDDDARTGQYTMVARGSDSGVERIIVFEIR